MSLRHLIQLRRLSTTRVLHRPALSADYKSKQLWEQRFDCDLLGSDSGLIKVINNKIITGVNLNNLEIDIFINIAAPRSKDISQLQEAVSSLRKFRRTIYANTLLPSTSHALCRLFLDSRRLSSIVSVLERRVEFGIFHDPFSLNLLFDAALEEKNYALGSRLAALIMLQEEFGVNELNDNFALYALAKYTESKTDFADWSQNDASQDPIFEEFDETQAVEIADEPKKEESKKQDDEEDEDDDEKEYVRVPFLRNPYSDNHFDLKDPRLICGKSLSMLGFQHLQNKNDEIRRLGSKCKLAGDILQAHWSEAQAELTNCVKTKVAASSLYTDTLKHYIENLNQLENKPGDTDRKSLMTGLDKISSGGKSLSEEAELRHEQLRDLEKQDIERMKSDMEVWSKARIAIHQMEHDMKRRKELVAEIKAKKEELKLREQYLYFYDNLKKTNLTRIEYE